ncbi:hypothetical protein EO244_15975 [Ancylomarina salipaludis]|uniref:Uncharacterized protein n=1 Tax=Ancylomarina salipaludis TaxID=2501299 RepID=A0A4Q1JIA1_9BACT|nr:hypothetical protein [Ancylomarina salipaludis]RXQ87856.1 hypothetical protein EO244_15975 [Ancylomarina salipaludis]
MFDTSFGLKTWIIPGLIWGICMYIMMTIILPLMDGELITWRQLYSLPIWLIGGLVMQYFQFKHIYKKGRREIGEKTD